MAFVIIGEPNEGIIPVMDKAYKPTEFEAKIYAEWERRGQFKAQPNSKKKPFTIILPPPNANADLHVGHAMYVYEDVMIRYHKLLGEEVLWLPGADHAGFETQFVFEKHLQKQDKSRFDYDRETLFKMIWDFVAQNRGAMEAQLKKLGFALDWSREKYTMDPDIVAIVHKTFKKLYEEGLVYRADRLVNYCVKDGTSFSDLEVEDKEVELEKGLYYVKFPVVGGGHIEIATTRPETMLGDVAVMVNPKDKRYKDLIGKSVKLPISNREVPIIADEYVDMKFGTGAVKVTPAHDHNDFEIAKKHNLSYPPVIGFDGKMQNTGTHYDGLRVGPAREKIEEELKKLGLLSTVKKHKLVLKTCYKCGRTLEPLPLEQWYINVKPLVADAVKLVKSGKVAVYPKRFTKILLRILEDFIDWNISRQIVWGIRIPAWKCGSCSQWTVTDGATPDTCAHCSAKELTQDSDTFDTWFSSSQWPFATLQSWGEDFYNYFYPTSVMETGYDILRAWVARMIMMGQRVTGREPFQTVFLHGLVRDRHGAKMSKSKGNVVNPIEMVERHGADAFRAALLFNVKEGNDVSFSEERVVGMRNFANKIWNMGRFIQMSKTEGSKKKSATADQLKKEFVTTQKAYTKHMEKYEFSKALGLLHEFIWHRFADFYIEELKEELKNGNIEAYRVVEDTYLAAMKLLHPFMPFVTEAVWKVFKGEEESILN